MAVISPDKLGPKSFLSYAMVQGQPETLIVKNHVSANAAEKASNVLMGTLPGLRTWGWAEITESDRKYGHII